MEMDTLAEMVLDKDTEVQEVETTGAVESGEKTNEKNPVLSVNLEVQKELGGKTPSVESPIIRVESQKEKKVQDKMQAKMMEEVAHTQKSSPIEGMIANLSEEVKKGFSCLKQAKPI
ncbi:hypothetical protein NDU88_001680 [Pleurodeles waltl]|uniref:Uncharacterized protein n=1 Tax=Pleurodeles waltl TaxID=8319 RepID=A0AAV7P4M3_PLEWA|nr:hypothetical protein NDU88_001680 [Pleurodeles waltl]